MNDLKILVTVGPDAYIENLIDIHNQMDIISK